MNLSKQSPTTTNEGAVLELRDLHGVTLMQEDGVTPVTITLLGKDSDVFVRAENAATNRRLAAGTRAKLTAEGLKAEAIAALAKCTIGWAGIGIDEDSTPFSYDQAVALYTRFPFIREQVDEFIADRSNFLQPSPTS